MEEATGTGKALLEIEGALAEDGGVMVIWRCADEEGCVPMAGGGYTAFTVAMRSSTARDGRPLYAEDTFVFKGRLCIRMNVGRFCGSAHECVESSHIAVAAKVPVCVVDVRRGVKHRANADMRFMRRHVAESVPMPVEGLLSQASGA